MNKKGTEIDKNEYKNFLIRNNYSLINYKEYYPNLKFFFDEIKCCITGLVCLVHLTNITIVDEMMIDIEYRNNYAVSKEIMLYILNETKKNNNTILRYNVRIENYKIWEFHAKRGTTFTGLSGMFINSIKKEFKNEK